jgi:hypothetical protein
MTPMKKWLRSLALFAVSTLLMGSGAGNPGCDSDTPPYEGKVDGKWEITYGDKMQVSRYDGTALTEMSATGGVAVFPDGRIPLRCEQSTLLCPSEVLVLGSDGRLELNQPQKEFASLRVRQQSSRCTPNEPNLSQEEPTCGFEFQEPTVVDVTDGLSEEWYVHLPEYEDLTMRRRRCYGYASLKFQFSDYVDEEGRPRAQRFQGTFEVNVPKRCFTQENGAPATESQPFESILMKLPVQGTWKGN